MNMKNLLLPLMSSCISFVSNPPAAGPPVLPFPQLQNFGEVFPGFCWDSVHNPKGGVTCGRVGKAGWDQGKR